MTQNKSDHENEMEQAWDFYSNNEYDKAKAILNKIFIEKPNHFGANALMSHITFNEAISGFNKCLKLDKKKKKHGFLYYWIGRAYGEFHSNDADSVYDREVTFGGIFASYKKRL